MLKYLIRFLPTRTVYAHCDIPCGIYDPYPAQIAAHTLVRMTGLINDTKASSDNAPFDERKKIIHQIARITHVKEEHGALVEHELGTLENDYFKEEHFTANPQLQDLIAKTVKLSVKARQEINMEAAQECLENVLKIAEIFWKTKGIESARMKAPYPSGGEIVIPKA